MKRRKMKFDDDYVTDFLYNQPCGCVCKSLKPSLIELKKVFSEAK